MKLKKAQIIEMIVGFGFWVLFACYSAFHWGFKEVI